MQFSLEYFLFIAPGSLLGFQEIDSVNLLSFILVVLPGGTVSQKRLNLILLMVQKSCWSNHRLDV